MFPTKIPNPDEDFFGYTLMILSLDERAQIVDLFSKHMNTEEREQPDCEYIAWQWYGKDKTQQLSAHKKEEVFKAMQWLYDHRDMITDHKMMRDNELQTNIYKWKEIDGQTVVIYDDYKDWTYYTREEKLLLFKECQVEAAARYRRKYHLQ